ncbi:hypothetical protein AB3M83_08970 [Microbacterium sp. 179-B 1A2 NHS]|uniref:hypothetical protein n=1 Tax=Microbacterium sp. 179-B 1A2 NHS TaxID=3142383 RepID=UPI0039A2C8B7
MGLESLEAEIASIRESATSVQRTYSQNVTSIQNDATLSDTGKSDQKADAYAHAKADLGALRQREEAVINAAINSRKAIIEAPTKPTASSIISYRDAQDRTDRIADADEAKALIERALRQDDLYLAHAIFDRATQERWHGVAQVFTHAKPEYADTVRELQTLIDTRDAGLERTMQYAIFAS